MSDKNPVIEIRTNGTEMKLFRGRVNLDKTDLRIDPDTISTVSSPSIGVQMPIYKTEDEIDRLDRYNRMMGRIPPMYAFAW